MLSQLVFFMRSTNTWAVKNYEMFVVLKSVAYNYILKIYIFYNLLENFVNAIELTFFVWMFLIDTISCTMAAAFDCI